jgi:PBP1b-binding outer membrane lipoprotein LpoB
MKSKIISYLAIICLLLTLNSCLNQFENARIDDNTKLKTEVMIKELSRKEFEKTFSNKMIDVTKTAEPIVNIWKYAKVLSNQKLIPSIVYNKELVEFVYKNSKNTFEHILLPTSEKNVFIIIVVNIIEKKIEGHYKIDIEKEYGLNK